MIRLISEEKVTPQAKLNIKYFNLRVQMCLLLMVFINNIIYYFAVSN